MNKLYVLDYADMINPAQSRFMIRIPEHIQSDMDKDGLKDGDSVDTTDEDKEIVVRATLKHDPKISPSKFFVCHWGTSKPYSQYLNDQSDMIKKLNTTNSSQSKEEEKAIDARIMEFKDGKIVSKIISINPPEEEKEKDKIYTKLSEEEKNKIDSDIKIDDLDPLDTEPSKPEIDDPKLNKQPERKNAGQKSK